MQNDEKLPDLTAQFRYDGDWGHVQVAGILRKVGYRGALGSDRTAWTDGSEMGWGINLGRRFNVLGKDAIRLQVVYGEGIASYMNDGGMDLAPTAHWTRTSVPDARGRGGAADGRARLLRSLVERPVVELHRLQLHGGGQHQLPGRRRYQKGQYASVNLLYYPVENVMVGARSCCGASATNNDGAIGRRRPLPVHRQVQLRHQRSDAARIEGHEHENHQQESLVAGLVATLSLALAVPAYARGPVPTPPKEFQRLVDAAYAKYKGLQDGKNADYIPILTETPSDLFGVVIVTQDGKVYSAGDVDYKFSIQSVSKPFTAALVMTQQGPEVLKEKIGVEPTGLAFNSKLALAIYEKRRSIRW